MASHLSGRDSCNLQRDVGYLRALDSHPESSRQQRDSEKKEDPFPAPERLLASPASPRQSGRKGGGRAGNGPVGQRSQEQKGCIKRAYSGT